MSHALTLVALGAAAGVAGLDDVLFHLTTLDVLLYDINVEGVSLDQLQNMSTLEVCSVLMKMVTILPEFVYEVASARELI